MEIQDTFLLILRKDIDREKLRKNLRNLETSEWEALYEFSGKSGLFPVFCNRLLNADIKDIPPDIASRLKNAYFLNLRKNMLLEKTAFEVLRHFQESDIAVMPLKGPILARYLYGDPALRHTSCDLDMLVKYEKIEEAEESLQRLGYSSFHTDYTKDFLIPLNSNRQIRQICFARASDGPTNINLDLHCGIRGFFSDSDMEGFWERAGYFDMDGLRIRMPSGEDMLVYLGLISITVLEFVQLRYIYDLHTLVEKFGGELDWRKALRRIRRANLGNPIYFALKLSQDLFSTDIPKEFFDGIRPNRVLEKLFGIWINKKSSLEFGRRARCGRALRLLLNRYFYSKNNIDFLKKAVRRWTD